MDKLKILFSRKPGWEKNITIKLEGYKIFFNDFDEVNLNEYDLIIPLTLYAQKYYNNSSHKLPSKIIVPSNYCINLCDDKVLFNKFLTEKGFADFVPKTTNISNYPYILKPRVGQWGTDISIIRNRQDEIINNNKIKSTDYFKQDYINGNEEYTTHIIMKDRKIIFCRTLKFNFTVQEYVKGRGTKSSSIKEVDHSKYKKLFLDVLVSMDYQGICCFNYKIVNSQPLIFEVNPRYGGSMTYFIKESLPLLMEVLDINK